MQQKASGMPCPRRCRVHGRCTHFYRQMAKPSSWHVTIEPTRYKHGYKSRVPKAVPDDTSGAFRHVQVGESQGARSVGARTPFAFI